MIDYYETKSQPITRVQVWEAYWKVRKNKGGMGTDNMSWDALDRIRDKELYKLWNRLSSGSYFPPPVKEVEIDKKDGGKRKLGIPKLLSYYLFAVCIWNVFMFIHQISVKFLTVYCQVIKNENFI